MAEQLDVLRASVARLRTMVEGLDPGQLEVPAYPTEWTVADVLSHVGSGAVILERRFDDAVTGTHTPSDFAPAVWDAWNAKTPGDKAADALVADRSFVDRVGSLTDAQRAQFSFAMGPMVLDLAGFLGLRLNEHALHSWDVAVTFDPGARVAPDAVDVVIDNLQMITRLGRQAGGHRASRHHPYERPATRHGHHHRCRLRVDGSRRPGRPARPRTPRRGPRPPRLRPPRPRPHAPYQRSWRPRRAPAGVPRSVRCRYRQKCRNLRRNPNCDLFIIDPRNPLRTLEVRAEVELTADRDKATVPEVRLGLRSGRGRACPVRGGPPHAHLPATTGGGQPAGTDLIARFRRSGSIGPQTGGGDADDSLGGDLRGRSGVADPVRHPDARHWDPGTGRVVRPHPWAKLGNPHYVALRS